MAYSFANRSREQRSADIPGTMVLKVESLDHERNAVTGFTRDGEVVTIRLANKEEFANLFVNRTRNTTEEARLRVSGQQTSNRPTTRTLAEKMQTGEGAIQFQSLRKTPQGELVARWMESVSTTAEDTYVHAQVRIPIPRSNQETAGGTIRRRADIVLEPTATAATMDALDRFTTNRLVGDDGKALEADIRSAVLVAVQSADDPGETPTSLVWSRWDEADREFKAGGADLFKRPLNEFNWQAMVPLAAQVGVPFKDLSFDDRRVSQRDRAEAETLYRATQAGEIKVAVAQGFQADIMPRLTGSLVQAEVKANESEGRQSSMSDRGFFEADIGFRLRQGQEGYSSVMSVKQILATEFLPPKASESYSNRTLEALGQRVVAAAEAGGQDLTMRPAPAPKAAPEPSPEPVSPRPNTPSFSPSI